MRYGALPLLIVLLTFSSLALISSHDCDPQQIHLTLSDAFYTDQPTDNQIKIIFHTVNECSDAYIQLTSNTGLNFTLNSEPVMHFTAEYEEGNYSTYIHVFEQSKLDYNQIYSYTCYNSSDPSSLSSVQGPFEFYLPSPDPDGNSTNIIMLGDFDSSSDGQTTLNQLKNISLANFSQLAAIIHMGDIAYDLESDAGENGDDYMNAIQSVVSNIPYVITPGNHETLDNFSNVNSRFQMPLYGQSQNHFYSWNINNIHFASINFDLFIFNDNNTYFLTEMAEWLDNDLAQANQTRDIRPWIIVYTHRPLYCSKKDDDDCLDNHITFSVIDDILYKYKVDLYVSGHVHVYERMYPIYNNTVYGFYEPDKDHGPNHNIMLNPEATVHIVQGMAGHTGDPSNQAPPKMSDLTLFINTDYSILGLHSLNNTCLYVESINTKTASIMDYLYLIKDPDYLLDPPSPMKAVRIAKREVSHNAEFVFRGLEVLALVFAAAFLALRKWRRESKVDYERLGFGPAMGVQDA